MNRLQLLYANRTSSLAVDSEGNEYRYEKTAGDIITGWCIMHGSTVHGRQDAMRQIFGWHQKIPVLISEITQEIWFPIAGERAEENIWVCYDGVFAFHRKNDYETRIEFACGLAADIGCNVRTVRMQMKRCRELVTYLNETGRNMNYDGTLIPAEKKKD